MKFGALTACDKCHVTPRKEDEIAISLLMIDRNVPISELEALSQAMRRGEVRPMADEKTMELLRPIAREAQRMLGIKEERQ